VSQSFRAGVGLVLADAHGRVYAVERARERGAWQLPQGGIEIGETPEDAAWRELEEELALRREHVELVAESRGWTVYELPRAYRKRGGGRVARRGQAQRWFLFRLREGVQQPDVSRCSELRSGRWTTLEQLAVETAAFRQPVYRQLLAELGRHLDPARVADVPRRTDGDFLVADFQHFAESYWRNEEMGERRLQFLIGLVTATAGGIGLIGKTDAGFLWSEVRGLALVAALLLLGFGLLTFRRMLHRRRVTKEYLGAMRLIRAALLPATLAESIQDSLGKNEGNVLLRGGLAPITILVDAALAGVAGAVAADFWRTFSTSTSTSFTTAAVVGVGIAAALSVGSLLAFVLWRNEPARKSQASKDSRPGSARSARAS
jgi:putative (di)nucleoside polyphosphate hydrolase